MKHKTIFKFAGSIFLVLTLSLNSSGLFALDLDEAKEAGLIGEQADGYVGAVVKPVSDEIKFFIKNINEKRKAKYQEIADKREVELSLVEQQSGKKLIERLKSGQFFKKKGEWEKK